ncbi:MAG: PD-(D/E)XK nuclease family protein, partial [Solirubrobacteraceae bacterium]
MPLKLVLGPANSAKAGEVLGSCAAAARRGPVLVVPTRQDVERYSRELAERGAVVGCSVVTFAGLMREIARRAGYRPATLTRLQRERVLRRTLGQTRFRAIDRSAGSPGFANAAWGLISELERALAPPDRFSDALRSWAVRDPRRYRYAEDLAALYDAYADELRRLGRVDGDLYAWRSVDALAADPEAWGPAPVFVYGFDDLTPTEHYALETLSGPAGAQVVVSLTWEQDRAALAARADAVQALRHRAAEVIELPALADHYEAQSGPALHHLERQLFEPEPPRRVNPGAAIRLLEAGGQRAETELVAAEVLALLRAGVPASEIVVVHRSLRGVGPLVERVFESSGIPIALHRDVPFTHTALGRGVLSLVKCALLGEGQASAADLLSYLRTPGVLDQLETADGVEATVRTSRIRTAAQALTKSHLRLAELEALRRARDPLQELGRQARHLFSSHRRGLAPVLDRREELDGRALSTLLRALDELEELREPLRGEELVDVLEDLAVPVEYAPTAEAVLVAEPLGIRARRFRVVFVCGLQESEFPRSGHPDPFLGDELRRELAAITPSNGDGAPLHLHPREDALEQERYLFYTSVTRATEQVILSYRSSDEEGGVELPSPFIADVADLLDPGWLARRRRRLLADVVWAPHEAPTVRELARSHALAATGGARRPSACDGRRSYVVGEAALGHVRHRRVVSAGALESYAECPVKWLVERELRVESLAPETDGMVRGHVVHRVLEELYRRLGTAVTEATLAQAQTVAGELLRKYAEPIGAAQPAAIRAGLVRAIEADIDRFLALEASSGADWSPSGLELRFGFEDEEGEVDSLPALELAGGVRVRGVIDRVDIEPPAEEGAEIRRRAIVRDYKTGATRPEYQGARWAVDRQLQVPLYMLAIRELLSLDPVAGFYQPVGGDDLRPRGVFVEG